MRKYQNYASYTASWILYAGGKCQHTKHFFTSCFLATVLAMEEHVEEATGQVTRKPVSKTGRKRKREVTETEEPPAIVAKIDKSPMNKKVT